MGERKRRKSRGKAGKSAMPVVRQTVAVAVAPLPAPRFLVRSSLPPFVFISRPFCCLCNMTDRGYQRSIKSTPFGRKTAIEYSGIHFDGSALRKYFTWIKYFIAFSIKIAYLRNITIKEKWLKNCFHSYVFTISIYVLSFYIWAFVLLLWNILKYYLYL